MGIGEESHEMGLSHQDGESGKEGIKAVEISQEAQVCYFLSLRHLLRLIFSGCDHTGGFRNRVWVIAFPSPTAHSLSNWYCGQAPKARRLSGPCKPPKANDRTAEEAEIFFRFAKLQCGARGVTYANTTHNSRDIAGFVGFWRGCPGARFLRRLPDVGGPSRVPLATLAGVAANSYSQLDQKESRPSRSNAAHRQLRLGSERPATLCVHRYRLWQVFSPRGTP